MTDDQIEKRAREVLCGYASMNSTLLADVAAFARSVAQEARQDERTWLDAVYYDAMKWAGIGGIMRSKVRIRVDNIRDEVLSRPAPAAPKTGGGK